jgi:extracellular factor (EF) 3-hydroxypalmitic acid methyl ester biosynthesis protein
MDAALAQGRAILDQAYQEIESRQSVDEGMDRLVVGLRALRQSAPPRAWETFCRTECVGHPVRFLVHQDPLTGRAFFKPRGYPGDAVLLDLFYGAEGVNVYLDEATPLGRQIYHYTSNAPAGRALRRRKEILATMIDQVSETTSATRIMTLGCGHLREAELSSAVKQQRVDRFLAVDRDPDSLRVVREKFGPLGVETAESTVNELIDGADRLGTFDLVYAAGPYDHLNRLLATRLTEALFRTTRPGGVLLVTNFVHGIKDVGYMEAFMDWHVTHRNANDMFSLTSSLPVDDIADRRTFAEESGGIVFLAVRRR